MGIQPVWVLRVEETPQCITVHFAIGKCRSKRRCAVERAVIRSARRLAFGELEGFSDVETRRGCRVSIPATITNEELRRRIKKCFGGFEAAGVPAQTSAASARIGI